jgi:hypothetical protein
MDLDKSQELFLEINGKKTGPFTVDQIEALLRERELTPQQKITSNQLDGKWISIQDLLDKLGSSTTSGFKPPPRPLDINQPTQKDITIKNDPVLSLLAALQADRERKETQAAKAAATAIAALTPVQEKKRFPLPILLISVTAIFITIFSWGLIQLSGITDKVGPSPAVMEASKPRLTEHPQGGPKPSTATPVQAVRPTSTPKPTTKPTVRTPPPARATAGPPIPDRNRDRDDRRDRYARDRDERDRDERDREERDRDERDRDERDREQDPRGDATPEGLRKRITPVPPPGNPHNDPTFPDDNAYPRD